MNALNEDEKKLVLHIRDLMSLSEKHYKPYYSYFLNEREASAAVDEMKRSGCDNYILWGGYENAERVMFCVYPPYLQPEFSDFPFECVNFKYRKTDKLTHRDFLGSLMALGIKREVLGDIVVGEGIASVFVRSEIVPYVRTQIRKIGRVGIEFTEDRIDFGSISQSFEEREAVVSSLRIDSIVGCAAKLSRSKSQQLIKAGLAAVNFKTVIDPDLKVTSGDKLSVRGYGKFIVTFDGLMSKKGKYRIVINKLK